jgi:ring-1,2-phenylacetyl-CoA epoxidase subunit PaaE
MTQSHDFHALRIARVERPIRDAIVVTFEVPPGLREAFAFKAGQHVAVRAVLGGQEERRNYSICARPGETLRIAIKRVPGGLFSTFAAEQWRAGSVVDVMPPSGRFVLPASDGSLRHVLMLAAGSGITPVLAMVKQALEAERQTHVTLVYGNRQLDSMLFREELEDLKDRHLGRFDLMHVLSRNDEIEAPLMQGRVTGEKITALAQRRIDVASMAHVFLCGPGSMIKETRDALFALGVPRDRVHHEFFAAGGGAPRKRDVAAPVAVEKTAPAFEIVAVLDGIRHRFAAEPGEKVIEAALRAGLKVPYACKGGMCCTCRARIVTGKAEMAVNYSLEVWEIAQGFVLTCQAVVADQTLVVDYDAM